MATRWGICAAGLISEDFCAAMKVLPSEKHQIVGVAARHLSDAEAFAEKYKIPKAYGSYEDLAEDTDVGVWSRFFPVYDQIRKEMADGTLGEVKLVQANISLSLYETERIHKDLGGGGLKDIGGYVIMATVLVFKEKPLKIQAEAYITSDGVDAGGCISLVYPGGRLACLTYHTQVNSDNNRLSILGTEGSILVEPPFWCPTKVRTPTRDYEFPLPENDHKFHFPNTAGLIYEQNEVRECLKKGLTESPLMTHEESRTISYICDEILRQYGIKYDNP